MKLITTSLIFAALCAGASAQTARQLFNPAAREYIHGNSPAASNLVEQARIKFPDDEKLHKLKKLIEEQQKQQQQNPNQKNQDQQNQDQDQPNEDQQNKEQKKSDPSDSSGKSDPSDEQDPSEKTPEQNAAQNEHPPESAPAQQAGKMSQEEAQQLLDAMKQNEKDQRTDLRPYLGQPVRVDKDW